MIKKILKDLTNIRPNDVFIHYKNDITYEDMTYSLEGRIKSMQSINIQKDNVIGLYLDNSLDILEILFACIEIQAIPLIIPHNFTSDEIYKLTQTINLNYIITNWNKTNIIKNHKIPIFPIEELSPGIGGCAPSNETQYNENQIACLLLTSGTTGKPKIAQISIKNIIASCEAWNKQISFQENDIYLTCLPIHHIGGLAIIFRALLYGFKIVLVDKFEKNDCINKIIHHKVTLISLVPTMLSRIIKSTQVGKLHRALRGIILSGDHCSPTLIKSALSKKINIYKSYGMTESCSGISGFWVKNNMQYINSVGLPHDKVKFKIDKNKILVKGPTIIDQYYNDTQINHWYNTNDLGHINNDGFLYVFGRDNQVISGGENIDTQEVKNIILSHPNIKQVFIKTTNDDEWGHRIVAYINSTNMDAIKMKDWLKTQIANYKIPKEFIFINDID